MAIRRTQLSGIYGYAARSFAAWSPNAIGGTMTAAGGYRIHTFTTVGADTFTVLANISSVEYLI